MKWQMAVFIIGLVVLVCASAVFATDKPLPSQYASMQAAIDGAEPGDTVVVGPGVIQEGQGPHAPQPYAPNQIIVKFRGDVADSLEAQLDRQTPPGQLGLSADLDRLSGRYKVKQIKPLFKDFKKNRQKLKALLKRDKALLTKKEKRILIRLARAPKDARVPDLSRIYKIEVDLPSGESLEDIVEAYNNDPDVEYAELNYIVSIDLTPSDPLYPIQWPLHNTGQMYPESGKYNDPPGTPDCDIDAPEAWDIHTGSSDVIVAVVDTGVDYTHRDMQANMWVNREEVPGNGVDDDGNGYIDDIYGYDFINNDSDPTDDCGHGTHCSGVIAAAGDNGADIAGVCWNAKIMGLKFLGSNGSGPISDAIEAFYYAVNNGADVISNSWGGGYVQSAQDAVDYAYSQGVIVTASAGNSGDTGHHYPANYKHVISVAATNSNDERASFSTYGDWVDIAAPGVDVLSLRASGGWLGAHYDDYTTIMSGTSMACPHISGSCALMLAAYPETDVNELEQTLLESTDPIAPEICQSGRLNLYESMLGMVKPQGIVRMQSHAYSCSSNIEIWLADSDLLGNATQEVTVTTSGGDSETVILSEAPAGIGVFSGTITTSSADPNNEDGILQILHDQSITATYEDANNGTGSPDTAIDTAVADCQGPVVFNVLIDIPGPEPAVTFETNEPTTVRVLCDISCKDPNLIVRSHSILVTNHSIKLFGVSPETEYFFIIEATDSVGNKTIDDNAGQCYNFTTDVPGDINVPSDCPTVQEAIDISWNGGTVHVADGIYTGSGNRDIDFKGKAITVRSENGPENCVVDCDATSPGFYFHNAEGPNSLLDGFTITNGCGRLVCGAYGCFRRGGGIYCGKSSPVIKNCIVTNNTADYGGGIDFDGGSAEITNCIIKSNSSQRGGGVYAFSNAKINNCIISNNYASVDGGGGIYGSKLRITNCVIAENSSSHGGGITCHYTTGDNIITNCTVVDNSAGAGDGYGGGIDHYCGNTTITNCIIRGNSAKHGNQIAMWAWGTATANVSYSNVQGGESAVYFNEGCILDWGPGNIDADPMFVDAANRDYHLTTSSPCINAGDPCYTAGPGETDIDGEPRVRLGRVDMGADELFIDVPAIEVSSPQFDFWHCEGGSPPEAQTLSIRNGGVGTLSWQVAENCTWLEAEPLDGESTGEYNDVALSVDIAGLAPGQYSCFLTISAPGALNSPQTIPVSLDVVGPQLSIEPNAFEFWANPEGPNPAAQIISIRNTGCDTLAWEISLPNDSNWLQVHPLAGQCTEEIDEVVLSVNVAGLPEGDCNCVLTVSAANAEDSPQTVYVDLFAYTILGVPSEQYPTIQTGIDAALDRDVVTVASGTYTGPGNRDLDFGGKAIMVTSENPDDPAIVAATVIDCQGSGRAFYFHSGETSAALVTGLTITNGYANYGGAIYCDGSSPTISKCTFSGNAASMEGGAIQNDYCSPTVAGCTFASNSASWSAGAMSNFFATPTVKSCIFSGNSGDVGGAIINHESDAIITNCTFSGNSAFQGGAINNSLSSGAQISNCILWGDSARGSGPEIYGACVVSYSDVQGGWAGVGNIDADPMFVDAFGGDYHLLGNSPAIDAGDPNCDWSNEPWPNGFRVNMGAYGNTSEAATSPAGFEDLAVLGSFWLTDEPLVDIAPQPDGDGIANFLDFALLVENWLCQP